MSAPAATTSPISTAAELEIFISSIPPSSTLYLDLEGYKLSRNGSIAIITVLIHPQMVVELIDVSTLKDAAFTTPAKNGKSLKSILEDKETPKCLWDVRNDADALWALHKVLLAGVTDVQLLENASRPGDKTHVLGLDKCIQADLKLGFMELNRWLRTKRDMRLLMTTDLFASRPMDSRTIQYCINDVIHLPALHAFYMKRIDPEWLPKAMDESERRVLSALSPDYEPQSPTKTRGPWGPGPAVPIKTLDEILDELEDQAMMADERDWMDDLFDEFEEQHMDAMERDMFGDDVGYYDYYDDDDGGTNAADGAFCSDAFASCWDKNS